MGRRMGINHSVYTVLNSAYMTFGKIFVKSYFKYNNNDCQYFFILDAGLTNLDKKWLQKFDKVRIIGSNISTSFKNGNTSADWTKTVVAKTYGLREIITNYNLTPIIMIDSDCLVLQNLSSIINKNKDIQICHRKNHVTPMLGSYVCFNKPNLEFLNKWIDTIPSIPTPWKESPALGKVYNEFKDKLSIDLIDERIVSCIHKKDVNDDVKIVHFKSGTAHKTIEEAIEKRIYDRGYKELVKEYLND